MGACLLDVLPQITEEDFIQKFVLVRIFEEMKVKGCSCVA
jgi:hypothetical protein